MECINRIEIQGTVGAVKSQTVGGQKCYKFSVATNYAFRAKDGLAVIETTWHNVVAWEGESDNLDKLEKGKAVNVIGRLRSVRYCKSDDSYVESFEIIARKVKVFDDAGYVQAEL